LGKWKAGRRLEGWKLEGWKAGTLEGGKVESRTSTRGERGEKREDKREGKATHDIEILGNDVVHT
jgi:hypothetical protein